MLTRTERALPCGWYGAFVWRSHWCGLTICGVLHERVLDRDNCGTAGRVQGGRALAPTIGCQILRAIPH
jgi:hypothetical protein